LSGKQPYVLWLPSWYPNRITPYNGDFIQRHARAVAAYIPVHVLHVIRDKEHAVTHDILVEEKNQGYLKETIIYFSSPKYKVSFFEKFFSHQKLLNLYNQHAEKIFSGYGLPQLLHVHVAYKAGIFARQIRKRTGISYLLTEHWTGYLKEAKDNFSDLPLAAQYMISKIIKDAELILPVSGYLGEALKLRWPDRNYETVPNVVDTSVFYPVTCKESAWLKLIHISSMNYQKDPESLFKAIGILKTRGILFTLDVFGPVTDEINNMIRENKVQDHIILHGEAPQIWLAPVLQQADALILYSRYETFGCVIIEANACGVPVIAADSPLMRELIKDGINGIIVKPHSPEALAAALIDFADQRQKFRRNEIAASAASLYAPDKAGKMYSGIYDRILRA
jgi:glycosyltransferase involved in cell wall biosynthesis